MTLPAYAMNQSNFAQMYEGLLVGPLFRPWVDDLLDGARIAPGDRVLDLACGTGIVARLAKERLGNQGRVVAVDLSTQMAQRRSGHRVARGERHGPAVRRDGTVRRHHLPARAPVLSGQAVGGPRNAPRAGAGRHLGTVVDHRYGFGDPLALERLLAEAGFKDVHVETVSKTIRFADGAVYLHMNTMALVGMSAVSATCSDEQRAQLCAAIAKESINVLPPYADGEGSRSRSARTWRLPGAEQPFKTVLQGRNCS